MSPEKKKAALLREAGRRAARVKTAAGSRDGAIVDALEFASIREVAAATGLSPARIHQIRHGK